MSKVISKDKVKKGKHIWKVYTSLSQELRVGLIWIKRDQGPKSCNHHHASLFMKPQIHMPQVLKVFTMPTMAPSYTKAAAPPPREVVDLWASRTDATATSPPITTWEAKAKSKSSHEKAQLAVLNQFKGFQSYCRYWCILYWCRVLMYIINYYNIRWETVVSNLAEIEVGKARKSWI